MIKIAVQKFQIFMSFLELLLLKFKKKKSVQKEKSRIAHLERKTFNSCKNKNYIKNSQTKTYRTTFFVSSQKKLRWAQNGINWLPAAITTLLNNEKKILMNQICWKRHCNLHIISSFMYIWLTMLVHF